MAFSPKNWQDAPSISTQITAAALIDLETRLAAYTDSTAIPLTEVGAALGVADLNAAGTLAITRHPIVPELETVQIKNTFPEASGALLGTSVKVMARDPRTGTVAAAVGAAMRATSTAVLWGASSNLIGKSTDDGATWSLAATIAGYTGVDYIKVLDDGTILILVRNGAADSVAYDILRSTDGGSTFPAIGSQPFTRTTPFSRLLNPHSWCQMPNSGTYANNLFMGEYGSIGGSSNPAVRVFRSTDRGATWSTVASFDPTNPNPGTSTGYGPMALDEIRHVHEVKADPYVTDRIWITIGDNLTGVNLGQPRIGFSDDGGVTWTQITRATKATPTRTNASYQQSRAVGLMFTATAVFWFGDTPDADAYIYRFDRSSHVITRAAGPYPNSGQNFSGTFTLPDGTTIMLCALSVEPATQINRDDYSRLLGSADGGETWGEVFTWKRTQINQTSVSASINFTDPDANGDFWYCIDNVDGGEASGNQINMKLRTRTRRTIDRPRPHAGHRDRFELAAAEEVINLTHPDTGGAGVTATAADSLLWQAPTDIIVVSFAILARGTVASSGTAFWTPTLRGYRAGSNQYTIGQVGGANVTVTANTPITQLNASGLLKVKAGDWISLGATMTSTPAALIGLTASLRVRRANVII